MSYDFKKIETSVREFWAANEIYQKAKASVQQCPRYYFLDGPPYTSGHVHLGTAWNKSLKDMFIRYKRMTGFNVWDRAGYDMHGLPTERATEKELKIFGKDQIMKYGRDSFVGKCKEICVRNMLEMNRTFEFMGVWMDFLHAYQSISNEYIDGIWWFIKRAHETGRLYEAEKTMTWDAVNGTALAKHELEYQNVTDNAIFVRFRVPTDPFPVETPADTYFIIWTTTPWTIPFNLAVMAGPEIDYVKVLVTFEGVKQYWIIAKLRIEPFLKAQLSMTDADIKVVWQGKGKDLFGISYIHPFSSLNPVYSKLKAQMAKAHSVVLSAQFVDTEAGTGLVHCAPGCGPEDYAVGQENGILPFNTTDEAGVVRDLDPMTGLRARLDDCKFVELIKKQGCLVHTHIVQHDYPYGERSKMPVIFRTTKQWFLHVEDLKQKLLEANASINWNPQSAKNAFTAWLSNLRDNSISKQRFWGTPLPIWRNVDDPSDVIVIGNGAELCELAGIKEPLTDLHPPTVDKIEIHKTGKDGKPHVYRRIPDVLDVWVDAGSASWNCLKMPPSVQQQKVEDWFPAEFILEGRDQIRGWYNLLHLESMVAMGQPCFRNVYMHGFVQDSQGRKMSKTIGNYILPSEIWDKYGVDTMRYYLVGASQPGTDLSYNFNDVEQKLKNIGVFWNIHNYLLVTVEATEALPVALSSLDAAALGVEERYIISRLHSAVREATDHMEHFRLNLVPGVIEEFLLELSHVYIQMIWEKKDTGTASEKLGVTSTLTACLVAALEMFAPIAPFVSERMYLNLRAALGPVGGLLAPESLHLCRWPACDAARVDPTLEADMGVAKDVVAAILASRDKANLPVKQPAREVRVECQPKAITSIQHTLDLIKGRTNVKAINFDPVATTVQVSPNQKTIGKQFGRDRARVIAALDRASVPGAPLAQLLSSKKPEDSFRFDLELEGGSRVTITEEHVMVSRGVPKQYVPGKAGDITTLLDTTRTEELELEGRMRELARRVQLLRKTSGFKRTDRVKVELLLPSAEALVSAARANADWLRDRTGASEVVVTVVPDPAKVKEERAASSRGASLEKLGAYPVAILLF